MNDIQEQTIGGLTIKIDRLLCVGFGDCMTEEPAAFEFDHEGIAVLTSAAGEVSREHLIQACEACPVDAIAVFDSDGGQIVP